MSGSSHSKGVLILSGYLGETFAYSKLIKEVEALSVKLSDIEDKLDNSLDALGNMKEDELRARQQLEEVNNYKDEVLTKLSSITDSSLITILDLFITFRTSVSPFNTTIFVSLVAK